MDLKIPGYGEFQIEHVVFDLNGTLAVDGLIPENVRTRIRELTERLNVIIASADTHGNLQAVADSLGVECLEPGPGPTTRRKLALVKRLGPASTIAIGNGANDVEILREAAIGIAVIGPEGASPRALLSADIIVNDISDALDCLLNPLRMTATLRDQASSTVLT